MSNPTHMLNFKNDYFEVLSFYGRHEKCNDYLWLCRCKCGKEVIIKTSVLRSEATKSCGCARIGKNPFKKGHPYGKRFKPTHGLSKHPLFRVWSHIIDRCYNLFPEHKNYRYYQGKGIKMCDLWKNNFKEFYDWAITSGWSKGLTIDRKDSTGDYEPSNCEFVTRQENSRRMAKNNINYGAFNGNSVLTESDIKDIRNRLINEPGSIIAKEYNVNRKTIYDIKDRKTWKHI